jgi:hypothetical protein
LNKYLLILHWLVFGFVFVCVCDNHFFPGQPPDIFPSKALIPSGGVLDLGAKLIIWIMTQLRISQSEKPSKTLYGLRHREFVGIPSHFTELQSQLKKTVDILSLEQSFNNSRNSYQLN